MKQEKLLKRLEAVLAGLDSAIDWGQDCMTYALQSWEYKYGEEWRSDELKAIAAKKELIDIIAELRRG